MTCSLLIVPFRPGFLTDQLLTFARSVEGALAELPGDSRAQSGREAELVRMMNLNLRYFLGKRSKRAMIQFAASIIANAAMANLGPAFAKPYQSLPSTPLMKRFPM